MKECVHVVRWEILNAPKTLFLHVRPIKKRFISTISIIWCLKPHSYNQSIRIHYAN